jgi:hypothetical protein
VVDVYKYEIGDRIGGTVKGGDIAGVYVGTISQLGATNETYWIDVDGGGAMFFTSSADNVKRVVKSRGFSYVQR